MADNNNTLSNLVDFGAPDKKHSIIKVIGVGGGGGNAVNHMYREGIHDVSFVLCNTDAQALNDSPVPVKLQLGTEGLGAGNRPARAREAAEETIDAVRNMLSDGTKMTFITAGMGGGTGTGAAPVIARESKAQGILTVGIVTIPFQFEGKRKIDQALNGVEEIANNVDALLVINNQRLLQIYPDLPIMQAFGKADDTLSIAAKSIAEIITEHGIINLDFNDVKTVLKDGGVAIMSTGYGEGEGRVKNAIRDALDSPLLNNKDIYNSKKILLAIYSSAEKNAQGLMMDEMNDVNDFMDGFSDEIETKWGLFSDPELGDKVKVTILATGFGISSVDGLSERVKKQNQEEAIAEAARAEAEAKRDERRRKYYGDTDNKFVRRAANVYIFNAEDLDNDTIIDAVENTPTAKRTRQQLNDLISQSTGAPHRIDLSGSDHGADKVKVISFT
ncbi:cell division protein FtsZ [Prevotella sp. PINT]|jgi:cell division protein FtsZ|uniref:cell division protein FtsZ n=1 Tax=Palleniella intestinalis TaxID=2736291 RepID=UPI0015554153|nr:cell division protein FtsZ [Palleniella intestinalis]NPD81853.1 cell division protein FtsZ [Palleniella intestinalis]